VKDVVCPYCGCLCDDIEVRTSGNMITEVCNACKVGDHVFSRPTSRELVPRIRVKSGDLKDVRADHFHDATLDESLTQAAMLLEKAERPVLFGWSSTSTETICEGLDLAEELGALVDNCSSFCHGPSIQAIQEVGISSATLGEVLNHADCVVYWGSNPAASHDRHLSRYTVFPQGAFREKGRDDRKVVVVDVRPTGTAEVADKFIKVRPGSDYETLCALRMLVQGKDVPDPIEGVPLDELRWLSDTLKSSEFCAFFFGLGLTTSTGRHRNVDALLSLIRDLSEHTKAVVLPMRGHYNVTGACEAFTWRTGYPFAVDLSRGHPRYNPGETDLFPVLSSGECDCLLVVASDPAAHLPLKSLGALRRIPVIVIDPVWNVTSELADVYIPCTFTGIESEGTAYRMDGVPVRMRAPLSAPGGLLPDREIVHRLRKEVARLREKEPTEYS